MPRTHSIITLADIRDSDARREARQLHRDRRMALAAAGMKLARANERYQEFGGSIHRLVRIKAGIAYRAAQVALYGRAIP